MSCAEIAALAPLYHSSELDPDRASAFTAHLKVCPHCAAEIGRERELDARLRDALVDEAVDSRALESRIRAQIAARQRRAGPLWATAAAAVVLLAAGGLFYAGRSRQIPRVFADAARDHRREVVDRQPKKWRSAAPEIQALAEKQGLPATTMITLAPAGYRLDRARLCRLDGRIFLHLVYSDGAREVSVFLRKPDAGYAAQDGVTTAAIGQEHLSALKTDRVTGMCVAEDSAAALAVARATAALL